MLAITIRMISASASAGDPILSDRRRQKQKTRARGPRFQFKSLWTL
jgi:hypothetical protein